MPARIPAATDPDEPLFDPERDVVTEAASLQGLAHPLRLRLLGWLRLNGPSTATRLAAALAISSGLASYHLRQLGAAGFILDAEAADLAGVEVGGGRERWWKAARRSTFVMTPPAGDEPAAAATTDYLDAVLVANLASARQWLGSQREWPRAWQELATFSDLPLSLTPEETRRLEIELAGLLARYPRHQPGVTPRPEAAVVRVQYQVFPAPDQIAPPAPSSRRR